MPLGTNPSFKQVRDFFGGTANLSAYVRGGSIVPNIPANSAISTTVAGLKLSQFSGADKTTPFDASANPAGLFGHHNLATTGTLSNNVTISFSGGTGNYSISSILVSDYRVSATQYGNVIEVKATGRNTQYIGEVTVVATDGVSSKTLTISFEYYFGTII